MSKGNAVDLGLKTAFDELFMSDAGRAENRLPKIYDIPLTEIDDFPEHPFKVMLDEDMDLNCGDIIDGSVSIAAKGREILDEVIAVASGKKSKSEALGLGDNEFVPWQIGATM